MRLLDWIGRIVVWISSLALCGGLFVGSLFAIFAAIGEEASPATHSPRYSTARTPAPILEADAFDVRKVAAFLAEPRTGSSSAATAPEAGLEQVRSVSAGASTPGTNPSLIAAAVPAGTPDYVGSVAVNLRAGPSKTAARLSTLEPGEALRVINRSRGWVHVVTAAGETGWIYGKFLDGTGEPDVLTAHDLVQPTGLGT